MVSIALISKTLKLLTNIKIKSKVDNRDEDDLYSKFVYSKLLNEKNKDEYSKFVKDKKEFVPFMDDELKLMLQDYIHPKFQRTYRKVNIRDSDNVIDDDYKEESDEFNAQHNQELSESKSLSNLKTIPEINLKDNSVNPVNITPLTLKEAYFKITSSTKEAENYFKKAYKLNGETKLELAKLVEFLIKIDQLPVKSLLNKQFLVLEIFSYDLSNDEFKFIIEIVTNNLKIKMSVDTVIKIIRNMINKSLIDKSLIPKLEKLFGRSMEDRIKFGMAIDPMLSLPISNFDKLVEKLKKDVNKGSKIIVENKYDGERLQIHASKKEHSYK